jgi:hypothetical protein
LERGAMEKEYRESRNAPGESGEASESVESNGSREERVVRANEIYREICRITGLKVSEWQDFPAWAEYVDGKIGETQLGEKAKTELEQFSRSFGKYVVIQTEDHKHEEEEETKKRAKQANKIYRMMCREAGLMVCFFHDFTSWSEYVEGKIDDAEFTERVKREIERIAADGSAASRIEESSAH